MSIGDLLDFCEGEDPLSWTFNWKGIIGERRSGRGVWVIRVLMERVIPEEREDLNRLESEEKEEPGWGGEDWSKVEEVRGFWGGEPL